MGVVTAAMIERMGCNGRVIALHAQSQPSMDAVSRVTSYRSAGAEVYQNVILWGKLELNEIILCFCGKWSVKVRA